ncbi:hypothetical protein GGX14DRAFT_422585 [Mycena pura]|uniref:HIT domain-containing protein n=1 Tax=Mycena pura TaxID=153505 RepID=A0AAD6YQ11_9AGAR|nr:hypothetical protein GGX14DRAFT_422585 [Mycena pura]
MSFAPKPGCPMCSIVASSVQGPTTPHSPSFSASSTLPEVLWHDDNFTAYREKANPVSNKGHIIVAFNLHVPSIYTLSSTDLPLLVNIRNLATRLLTTLLPPSSPLLTPASTTAVPLYTPNSQFCIGFITPPFSDRKIPVTDHLHAHAYILPADQLGWWRGIAYGPLAWYAIDDLIAEIRESVTNNRIKSGHDGRPSAPIDNVPDAGSRSGTANGVETTEPGLAANVDAELERGERTPTLLAAPRV